MLIIRRRVGERIVIGSNIEVTVASAKKATKKVVRLAIQAPKGIPVLRGEVHDEVVEANVAAASAFIEIELLDDSVGDADDGAEEGSEDNDDSD